MVRTHPTTGEDTVGDAVVLSTQGGVVLKYRDRIETGIPGRLVFDAGAGRPSAAAGPGGKASTAPSMASATLALSYLTGGLSWEADYAVEVDLSKGVLD